MIYIVEKQKRYREHRAAYLEIDELLDTNNKKS